AEGFETTVSSLGTPETWPLTYDIVLQGTDPHGKHPAYVLVGTPKQPGNVKTVTMRVSTKTYAIETVRVDYNNGAMLTLAFSRHAASRYHLPIRATVQARFPSYSGNADITYGTYTLNQPVPDSVFQGASH
ncbi:MAG: hypothetical protein JO199_14085, partial [Candidatus Eremiobacteraeota bacterium]|nr:hypothetical protein [Candidatus Eremiobacteraeota bacterium]